MMKVSTDTKLTLSVAEAADYIGVSSKTIYRAIESRRLKHARVGQSKCFRIRPEWLDDWINESAVEPEPAVSEVAIRRAVTPPRTARRGPYAQAQTPRRGFLK
ncbi:MAG: helix-turn-helix domain-containing protein [Thermoleophilaceae bacterium]|nr:helix-turn-helix domain-containing protein [Thermoleophilaceae bacterium]